MSFLVTLLVGFGLLGAWCWAMLWSIQTGNALLGRWLAYGLMIGLYGAMFGAVAMLRRARSSKAPESLPRPQGVPGYALPMVAILTSGDSHRGRSQGWFWFDGPWVVFEGERFSFRLAAQDLHLGKNSALLAPNSRRLVLPKGLPPTNLSLRVGLIERGLVTPIRYDKERLRSETEAWAHSAKPRDPSLFPPLRYPSVNPALPSWTRLAFAGFSTSLATWLLLRWIPGIPPERLWQTSVSAGLFIPLLFGIGRMAESINRRTHERAVDKFVAKHR